MSGVRLTRHYLPGMKARNWGRIVFVSSESAVQIPAEMIHYGMTKTAQFADRPRRGRIGRRDRHHGQLGAPRPDRIGGRRDFRRRPGQTAGRGPPEFEAEFFRSASPSSLLKRFATVEEVANMIVYVCSPLASATNGAALRVDGGVIRSIV